jgi:hypothetical protein
MPKKGLAWVAVFAAGLAFVGWLLLTGGAPAAPVDAAQATGENRASASPMDTPIATERHVEAKGAAEDAAPAPIDPSRAILGRVVDENGRAVADAEVGLLDVANTGIRTSLADGSFELPVARAGTYDVCASSPTFGFGSLPGVAIGEDKVDAGDLVLRPRPAVLAHLVFADGQPIARLRCVLEAVDSRRGSMAGATRAGARSCAVVTDPAGRLRAAGLAPGGYRLRVAVHAPAELEQQYRNIVLHTGAGETELVIDLHLLRLPGTDIGFRGWWEEHDAEVRAALAPGGDWIGMLDARGPGGAGRLGDRFVQRGSWWHFTVDQDGFWGEAMVHADRSRNETEVLVETQPIEHLATLRVRFTAVDETPGTLQVQSARATEFGAFAHFVDAGRDGEDFVFRATPGRHRVELQPGTEERQHFLNSFYLPMTRVVTLHANTETVEFVDPQRGGRAQVTVHFPDCREAQTVQGLDVLAEIEPAAPPQRLTPYTIKTPTGFEVRPNPPAGKPFLCGRLLRPGHHVLTIRADGFQTQQVGVQITAGRDTPIEVWLQP